MSHQLCSSADLRDAVLGEIFAGCYENELDIQSFVRDLDAFVEERAFKKVHYRTFLFYIDENFEKDLATPAEREALRKWARVNKLKLTA